MDIGSAVAERPWSVAGARRAARRAGAGSRLLRRVGFALAASLVVAASVPAARAADGCFMTCTMAELGKATLLDDRAVRDAARACKASCEGEARGRLAARGVVAEACRPQPLPPDAVARVLAASPRFRILLGVFAWEAVNPFPDKVLKGMSVTRMTPTMARQDYDTDGTIAPGEQGAFVVTDMGELIPQLGPTIRITGITACDVAPAR